MLIANEKSIETSVYDELASQYRHYRSSLPAALRLEEHYENAHDAILSIVCMATSYRHECIFYRTLRQQQQGKDDTRCAWASKGLKQAMLQIDALIGRVITEDISRELPLTL